MDSQQPGVKHTFCDCTNPSHNHQPPLRLPKTYRRPDWVRDKPLVENFLTGCDLSERLMYQRVPEPDYVDWIIDTHRRPGVFHYLAKIGAIVTPTVQKYQGVQALELSLMMIAVAHDCPVIDVYYEVYVPIGSEKDREEMRVRGLVWGRQLIRDEVRGVSWLSIADEREYLHVCSAHQARITGTPWGVKALSYDILTRVRQHNGMIVKLALRFSRKFTR
ncbi:hypothetical protein B0T21DRAFT_353058 [Apiosordaria backusii]|uniref:Uncharacterized protein n=1 Tax=Apiosordaria backusii TaxID=314023 RepID=A0AA39ZY54_9PEZI|nr:hypothetical protein B0T21DRAFT_353058 [Apiosordaria backusii]